MRLRPYQEKTIQDLYTWFEHHKGHPCLVLPTGSGKSHIIAAICEDAVKNWPNTRILMLTHVKELIEQNHEKLRQHWPNAPVGIYSASVGKKDLSEPITFAGIQSLVNHIDNIGKVDLVLIDEAHLVNHKDQGSYRVLLNHLEKINTSLRVIGLTATPYRLGHGLITEEPAIFTDLIEPVSIEELQYKGYLSNLRSKVTKTHLSTDGVHKRGGEYIESELQKAVDTKDQNAKVVDEVIRLAGDRKAWLFFCTGVDHAYHVRDVLKDRGINAETITGETPKAERERIIKMYKAGFIRALTNANVLTTGFDYPDVDLIVMMRPTCSPGLYVQMAGRGLRLKSHTDHCLVLDFAGVVKEMGPITAVKIPTKAGEGGIAPSKVCDECGEIVAASTKRCPACGHEFATEEQETTYTLHNDDIMGKEAQELQVESWAWNVHVSKKTQKEMIMVTYYGAFADKPIREYLAVVHGGYAGYKAMETLNAIASKAGVDIYADGVDGLDNLCKALNLGLPPDIVLSKKDGKFQRVIDRIWHKIPDRIIQLEKHKEMIKEDDDDVWI